MSVVPVDLTRLISQLNTSGLNQKDPVLYQIILNLIKFLRQTQVALEGQIASSGSGGANNAITALNTDVVAAGPGNVPATIQPNVVTYAKIQQVTALRLLGNPTALLDDVSEIELGDNLEFDGSVLDVTIPGGGGTGLQHRFLSPTHLDTVPAQPVIGDIVRAVGVEVGEGEFYSPALRSLVEEDFVGIRAAYMFGMNGFSGIGNFGTYAPPILDFVTPTYEQWMLAWEYIDAFLQALIVEDFEGIRAAYVGGIVPGGTAIGPGNSGVYTAYPLEFVSIPAPDEIVEEARWERLGIGGEGQLLTVVDGIPAWADIPISLPNQDWEDIPFDAADFTADGGTTPTWTVIAGDVERWQKQYTYNELGVATGVRYALYVRATTVGGSGPTQLRVDIPDTIIGRFAQFISIQENGAAANDVYVEYDDAVSTTRLFLNKIGGAVFDTTAAGTYLAFEISAVLA